MEGRDRSAAGPKPMVDKIKPEISFINQELRVCLC